MTTRRARPGNFSKVESIEAEVAEIRSKVDEDEGFWVADLNRPRESLDLWAKHLPHVRPFYAMKCCDEPHLLKFLADLGLGFDCASVSEMRQMLNLGVDPKNIVFSHPLKTVEALHFAKEKGIKWLVYDTEDELRKILKLYPEAEVFLRIKPKFTNAVIELSKKFGAEPAIVSPLLKLTKELGANFIGFGFHVGSLCDDLDTFKAALHYVSDLKKEAESLGLNVCFVDIGGGFLSPNVPAKNSFQAVASVIESTITELFDPSKIEFIAEPGRFIGGEYMDLHLPVVEVKQHVGDEGEVTQSVYIPDGMYGSFNAISYDHAEPHFEALSSCDMSVLRSTTLWGQTCDSADCIYEEMSWPVLSVGDLLTVRKFSGYTYSPTSFFNGFNHHKVFVINEAPEKKD